MLLSAGVAVAVLSVVAFVLLVMAGGDSARGFMGVTMALTLGVASTHLALSRYRKHGSFEIDGDEGVLRRYRAGRMTGEFAFDEVKRVWLTIDHTDSMGFLGTMPTWLQISVGDGQVFRIAKGSRQELEPVCEAMRQLGLAPN